MKRLLALLLVLGVFLASGPALIVQARADDEKKKDDKKKEDKKDEKKEDKKDDKGKTEEKLTDAQKEELKKLSGTFIITKFERDGKPHNAEQMKKMKVVQKGAEYSFHDGDDITLGKDTVYPDKNPKEIDSVYLNGTSKGEVVKGIYKIEGDTITYCWADPKKERPKEFATKADSGLTLMTLKKSEEKEKEKEKAKDKDKDKKDDK